MSNYYYDEKPDYLAALSQARASEHDLTQFLIFGLKGIELQCLRLFREIRTNVSKALFRNLMHDLFTRIQPTKKRVIAERQIEILKLLLEFGNLKPSEIFRKTMNHYSSLRSPFPGFVRDLNNLLHLGALIVRHRDKEEVRVGINLNWPAEITETAFFEKLKRLPKAKTHSFLAS